MTRDDILAYGNRTGKEENGGGLRAGRGCVVLAMLVILGFAVCATGVFKDSPEKGNRRRTQRQSAKAANPYASMTDEELLKLVNAPSKASERNEPYPEVPIPQNGECRSHKAGYASSPLKITADYGSHYFVKLVDAGTGAAAFDVFVHGGRSVEVDIPDGKYEIRYACGERWFGREHLFGRKTRYSKAEGAFEFSNGNGYSITLRKVRWGNLRTSSIDADEF